MGVSDEEEQALVQHQPALLGLKFRDDEERQIVQKVTIATLGLAVLSVILVMLHHHHKGSTQSIFHLILAFGLPVLGYFGVRRESARFIWCFHLGNVQFAFIHAVVAFLLFKEVLGLEVMDPKKECDRYKPMTIPAGAQPGRAAATGLLGAIHGETQLYDECIKAVEETQAHVPSKLFWWAILTAPLWFCMIYAAYQAHEYYFRLRIRNYMARTGEGSGGTATVCEPINANDMYVNDMVE